MRTTSPAVLLLSVLSLAACGGGGGGGDSPASAATPAPTTSYTIGGTVTGLSGSGLVLQNNGAGDLTVSGGAFTFTAAVNSGAAYAVTVLTQPSGPAQACTVTNGSGTVGAANITNVAVTCTTTASSTFSVGGPITGLSGTGLVLRLNGGNDLPVTANGTYAFGISLTNGAPYAVTVLTQPSSPPQTCSVTNGSGTITSANVSNAAVTCTTDFFSTFTVGGTVSGLSGTGLVLTLNGGSALTINTTGAFVFATSVARNSTYSVAVQTQPTNPSQTCSVSNPSGVVGAANVTNVTVTCGGATTFQFGPEVPLDQRQIIQDSIALGNQFFQSRLGISVQGNTTIYAFADIDRLTDAYMQRYNLATSQRDAIRTRLQNQVAEAGVGTIFANTGSLGWNTSYSPFKILIHEYFHVLQNEMVSPNSLIGVPDNQVPLGGPRWLIEGAAELVGYLAIAENGLLDFTTARTGKISEARSVSALLNTMETLPGVQAAGPSSPYTLGFVATDFLTRSSGASSLVGFWRSIGQGSAWQAGFASAFGIAIDAFYQQFEAHRSSTLPPYVHISGLVTDSSGARFSGIHVFACPVVPGSCGQAITAIDGSYAIGVADGSYIVQFGLTSDGSNPAGYYSSVGFTPSRSNATAVNVAGHDVLGISVQMP